MWPHAPPLISEHAESRSHVYCINFVTASHVQQDRAGSGRSVQVFMGVASTLGSSEAVKCTLRKGTYKPCLHGTPMPYSLQRVDDAGLCVMNYLLGLSGGLASVRPYKRPASLSGRFSHCSYVEHRSVAVPVHPQFVRCPADDNAACGR
jgi:hypothetical protein